MAMTDVPVSERPREKLLARGAETLTDAELLAIFVRTGVPGRNAVEIAHDIIAEFGGLVELLQASKTKFCNTRGLGPAKYAQLSAVLEIAKSSASVRVSAPRANNFSRGRSLTGTSVIAMASVFYFLLADAVDQVVFFYMVRLAICLRYRNRSFAVLHGNQADTIEQ